MRLLIAAPAIAAIVSCGPKALTLPDNPVDRAATCGVVAAAGARKANAAAVSKPLSIETSGHILHYPMLAASEGESFKSDVAAAAVAKLPELEANITKGKWQALAPACDAAYPVAASTAPPELPADALDAQLGCSVLGEYLSKAMASQEAAYGDTLSSYRRLASSLDGKVASKLSARGVHGFDATKAARDRALAQMVKLGSPVAVMTACLAKYPV